MSEEKSRSFLEVFDKMDWPQDEYNFPTITKYVNEIGGEGLDQSGEQATSRMVTPAEITETLPRFVSLLNDREIKELLMEILWKAAFTRKDSKMAVDLIIKQFAFCSKNREKNPSFDTECLRKTVRMSHLDQDIPMFGQILAPVLAAGYAVDIVMSDYTGNLFLEFFRYFGNLLEKAGLPCGVYALKINPSTSCGLPTIKSAYCPMIIHEDSDLDSAVECVIHAAWDYGGKLSWSLTHVLIQESVFDDITRKLIAKLKLLKHGPRLSPPTDLDDEDDFEETRSFLNMEVFTKDKNCRHKLFIGWDPSLMKGSEPRSKGQGIALLPFRTADEAIEMVNSGNDGNFAFVASVWTERLSKASVASKRLNVSTVWINSYGLIDPSVTFQPTKYYAINGNDYMEMLKSECKCYRDIDDDYYNSNREGDMAYGSDIPSASSYDILEKALKVQKTWSALKMEERISQVCDSVAAIYTSQSQQENARSFLASQLADVRRGQKAVSTVGDYDVAVGWSAAQVVMLNVDAAGKQEAAFAHSVLAAVAQGSAVLARSNDFPRDDTSPCGFVHRLAEGGKLPVGLVRLVPPLLLGPSGAWVVDLSPGDIVRACHLDDCGLEFDGRRIMVAKVIWTPDK